MQQTSGHGRGLTVTGVLLIVAGVGFGGVAGFLTFEAASQAGDVAGRLALLSVVAGLGGLLLVVGIVATLLGVVVSGIHASLVEQARALARVRG